MDIVHVLKHIKRVMPLLCCSMFVCGWLAVVVVCVCCVACGFVCLWLQLQCVCGLPCGSCLLLDVMCFSLADLWGWFSGGFPCADRSWEMDGCC